MNLGPVDYRYSRVPPEYQCSVCGACGIKLWCQYQTFPDHIHLLCGAHALADQKLNGSISEDGYRETDYGPCDQIGWLVPAVPTEDGETYWDYMSVPELGVKWWRNLPLRAPSAG